MSKGFKSSISTNSSNKLIPIKRQSWKLKFGDMKNLKKIEEDFLKLSSMFSNKYKKMFWSRKDYI